MVKTAGRERKREGEIDQNWERQQSERGGGVVLRRSDKTQIECEGKVIKSNKKVLKIN
jgi:hypothetical protein